MPYAKLKELTVFTVLAFNKRTWKHWDDAVKKMYESPTPAVGYDLKFQFDTDKGTLDLSEMQVMSLLMRAFTPSGTSTIVGKAFSVKNNGQPGKDIRYFFDLYRAPLPPVESEAAKAARMAQFMQTGQMVQPTAVNPAAAPNLTPQVAPVAEQQDELYWTEDPSMPTLPPKEQVDVNSIPF